MSTPTNRAFSHLISIRWDCCNGLGPEAILSRAKDLLKTKFTVNPSYEAQLPGDGGSIALFSSIESNLTVLLRRYNANQLITFNIEYPVTWDQSALDSQRAISRKVDDLKNELNDFLGGGVEKIPALKLGTSVPNYYASSDDRLLEYDFEQVLFDKKSDYQQVKILKSKTLGNALFLDDLQNLAEKDLPYTHGLMHFGHFDYKDKDILILGGGDGGLLHELLKENPKHVIMIDIDQVVIESCRVHLRGACGSTMDQMKTDKYEIIVADCIKYLEEYATNGKKFDVIFNDLTDIPLSSDSNDQVASDLWSFIKKILLLSFKCLPAGGKYFNHAIGSGCTSALEAYENVLKDLPYKIQFSAHASFVPSFLEEWVFYDITKLE
ncbi:spermine synthase-like [Panonychus citri]|uniref:spermine synthase-like n=1 Tax=Panonychus citri TaxID=50023 RepID=UPI00230718DF|nr:spermine synthase-like [Panonychus citri]